MAIRLPQRIRHASVLPLADDGSARFLPWLIGLMVYLAALSTGGGFAIGEALERWDSGLRGTVTVELPRPADGAVLAPDKLLAAMTLIQAEPSVSRAAALDADTQASLLQPWLGEGIDIAGLPLPVLVDVHLKPDAVLDTDALSVRLAAIVPGATVESHGNWLQRLFRVARVIELAGAGIVGLIAGVAVITVIFTTRTGLMLHAAVIHLLHLIGAPDAFVAAQFQWHAFRLGLRGGTIGLVLALLSFGALKMVASQEAEAGADDLMPGFHLPVLAWLIVLALPVFMGVVGLLTARFTVLRALARMP